jgi:epoxyqueuosine reductase
MEFLAALTAIEERTSSAIGVTDTSPFPDEEERILSRVAEGLHGGLSFTYAHPETASKPAESFPWASSIIVAAVPYLREGDGERDDRTVARFADGDRYDRLRDVLDQIADELTRRGHRIEIVFDDNRLLDRPLAVRAGVAWSGKSTMALTPGAGPWILLGSVVTDAELPVSEPMLRSCGTCDACMPACPTDAIIAPGVLDARRCISAVLQRRGSIDPSLRQAIGSRIYGCDDCLVACPPGQPALRRRSPAPTVLTPEHVLTADDDELERIVDRWYVPSRRMRFVRRNALVALGNSGDESSLALLSEFLIDDDELLASHAAWAIGHIAGPTATSILQSALRNTNSDLVRDELVPAITASERGGVYADVSFARR